MLAPLFPRILLPSWWLIGPSLGDLAELLIVWVSKVLTFWRGSISWLLSLWDCSFDGSRSDGYVGMCCTRHMSAFWLSGFSFGTSASEEPGSEQGLNVPYRAALSGTLSGLGQPLTSSGFASSSFCSLATLEPANESDAWNWFFA